MDNEFKRVLIASLMADHFIISKQLGDFEDGNLCCINATISDVYKNLLNVFKIEYATWIEPFSGRVNICSPSDDAKDIEQFFEDIEDQFIDINLGVRNNFKILMPQIYKDGKDLDTVICEKYIDDIEEFMHNAPDLKINIPISNTSNGVAYQTFSLSR